MKYIIWSILYEVYHLLRAGCLVRHRNFLSPFTPKNDQYQIYPAVSPNITPHSMKNWDFHSLLRWKMILRSRLALAHVLNFALITRLGLVLTVK